MKRILLLAGTAMSVVALASVIVSPPPLSKVSNAAILTGSDADPTILSIFQNSCQNCHSGNTVWPWYSHIAPMSWIIEKDVHEARSHMNLSRWEDYDGTDKTRILSEIGSVVRNRIMPPKRYTLLHPEAALNGDQIEQIYRWTRAARSQLRKNEP